MKKKNLQGCALVGAMLLTGCGETQSPPNNPGGGGGGGQTITGRERFGWLQTAESNAELGEYRYALYVDGDRRVLQDESCEGTATANAFECSAPLPTLSAGQHTLELAAFVMSGDLAVESAKSPGLQVTVAASTVSAAVPEAPEGPPESPDVPHDGALTSAGGLPLHVEIIARGLSDPVDLAAAPDGRLLVAERNGRVHVIDPAGPSARSENVTNGDQAVTLQSITLASDFAQSGVVFVAARANDTDKTTLRIMRMREAGGALGEAATIASEPIAVDGTAVLRTAPDGLLFVGIGAGSMATQAQTLSDAAGKILRLRHDGSAPDDNPWRSLVFSLGHHSPSGLAWHPSTRALFEVERNEIADEVNTIRAGANYGWPVTRSQLSRISGPIVVLPAETGPSGATFVAREDSPLFGDLIVSATGAADLLRVHVDADGRGRIVDQLLQRRFGRIGQVIAADGSLYIITANTDTWGSGHDLLIRVTAGAR